jgi:predicted kinase
MSEPRHVEAILVAGVAASGKSAFARALAARLRWTLLDLDTLTNPLFEYAGGDYRASTTNPSARSELDRARYACLYDSARENLSVGQNVILVAPFTSERTSRREWEGVPGRLGIRSDFVHLVWLDTPILEVARRMSQRAASRDAGKLATLEPTDAVAPPAVDHLRLDGMLEPARQVELFLRERELLRR